MDRQRGRGTALREPPRRQIESTRVAGQVKRQTIQARSDIACPKPIRNVRNNIVERIAGAPPSTQPHAALIATYNRRRRRTAPNAAAAVAPRRPD